MEKASKIENKTMSQRDSSILAIPFYLVFSYFSFIYLKKSNS